MDYLEEIARWISTNESLLSGLAAMVVLFGVIFSPLGRGVRRLLQRSARPAPIAPETPSVAVEGAAEPAGPDVATPAMPVPGRHERVLAVLAFDNLSSDSEMQYFSDGVSEEILLRLARGAKLKVIGKASSFQFRGERKAEAARALNCSHVLDGSIQRAAGRVRISAQMVDAATGTILWSDRFDRGLEDIFAVQDEISEEIAGALDLAISSLPPPALAPDVYDLYLRTSPRSYAPEELARHVQTLEEVTQRAPDFAQAWGRLAYVRAWRYFYQPFAERPAAADRIGREAGRALAVDEGNIDALAARLFVVPPFGRFLEAEPVLERLRTAPGAGDGRRYIGWYLRHTGRVREALEETERMYRLDALDPMAANLTALARMAAGRAADAVPIFEDLVERIPEMSFPLANLLRAHACLEDWAAVDRLLDLATTRQLREFEDGLKFIRAKRDPAGQLDTWRKALEQRLERGAGVDLAQLVYAAHLGLVDEAYHVAEHAPLGPAGVDDVMGPDGYRTALVFQAYMPEMRNDPRFPRLCARLGLVEFWTTTGRWPDCVDEVPYDFRSECLRVADVEREPFGAAQP